MRNSILGLVSAAALLASCQSVSTSPEQQMARPASASPDAALALDTFVQASCASCHGIETGTLSPNPNAPTFENIANRPSVTRDTLRTYLLDAHNYPVDMDFELTPEHADAVTNYILGLQSAEYTRPKD